MALPQSQQRFVSIEMILAVIESPERLSRKTVPWSYPWNHGHVGHEVWYLNNSVSPLPMINERTIGTPHHIS
jgi:hypothetical protein